jgi:hypothetical protein
VRNRLAIARRRRSTTEWRRAALHAAVLVTLAVLAGRASAAHSAASECSDAPSHPEWIFCDDFEASADLVGPGRYFEYTDDDGDFVPLPDAGIDGSTGMRARFQPGEVEAGSLKLGFGGNPNRYMQKGIRPNENFREVFYRMMLRTQPGWRGSPAKLSRITIFPFADSWGQAMIAHLWSDSGERLGMDPVRCVDASDQVKCTKYNDFDHMDWLGFKPGSTLLFATENSGRWFCVEHHVRLNEPGQSNGIQEFWIDDHLEARSDDLNFVRGFRDYGLNAVFFENYWNDGSPVTQERYFDNIVVSTQRIGCPTTNVEPTVTPSRPTPETPPATAEPGVHQAFLPTALDR